MTKLEIKLSVATWSFRVGHIHVNENAELTNGEVLPEGILCNLKPTKLLSKKLGFAMILFPLGSVHVLGLPLCKNCIHKAQKYYSNVIADTLGLPAGKSIQSLTI